MDARSHRSVACRGYDVLDAAFDATHRWLADGVVPPSASTDRAQATAGLAASAVCRGWTRARPGRTAMGNRARRGGPGSWRHSPCRGRRSHCEEYRRQRRQRRRGHRGRRTKLPPRSDRGSLFDGARLIAMYPTKDGYVVRVREATEKNLKAGYVTKWDADATIREAELCSSDPPLMRQRVQHRVDAEGVARPEIGEVAAGRRLHAPTSRRGRCCASSAPSCGRASSRIARACAIRAVGAALGRVAAGAEPEADRRDLRDLS